MSKEKAKEYINNSLKVLRAMNWLVSTQRYEATMYLNKAIKELEDQNMKKRKKSKWRIKRGVNFHDEMRKGKYGWNEAAHLGWF